MGPAGPGLSALKRQLWRSLRPAAGMHFESSSHSVSKCNCFFLQNSPSRAISIADPGLDSRDVAFMERLRNLAQEALTWEHLSDQQRLLWAAALELDVVPVQEMRVASRGCSHGGWVSLCSFTGVLNDVAEEFRV